MKLTLKTLAHSPSVACLFLNPESHKYYLRAKANTKLMFLRLFRASLNTHYFIYVWCHHWQTFLMWYDQLLHKRVNYSYFMRTAFLYCLKTHTRQRKVGGCVEVIYSSMCAVTVREAWWLNMHTKKGIVCIIWSACGCMRYLSIDSVLATVDVIRPQFGEVSTGTEAKQTAVDRVRNKMCFSNSRCPGGFVGRAYTPYVRAISPMQQL